MLTFSVGCTWVLHERVHLSERTAYAITLALLVVISFVASRRLVFPGSGGRWHWQLAVFVVASLVFRGAEFVGFVVVMNLGWIPYPLVIILVQGVSFCLKLLFYGGVLFSPSGEGIGTAKS